jgi:hypothetical protein
VGGGKKEGDKPFIKFERGRKERRRERGGRLKRGGEEKKAKFVRKKIVTPQPPLCQASLYLLPLLWKEVKLAGRRRGWGVTIIEEK